MTDILRQKKKRALSIGLQHNASTFLCMYLLNNTLLTNKSRAVLKSYFMTTMKTSVKANIVNDRASQVKIFQD